MCGLLLVLGVLYYTSMHLEKLQEVADVRHRGRMQMVMDILARAIKTSRSMSHDLSPPMLYRGSLNTIFGWLAARNREDYCLTTIIGMPVNLCIESEILRVFLFRAVQELLFNVVKHAGVLEAFLTGKPLAEDLLLVTVADEGKGFDPAVLSVSDNQSTGFGLFSTRERLQLLGGSLKVECEPDRGSRFIIRLPLHGTDPVRLSPEDATHGNISDRAGREMLAEEEAPMHALPRIRVLLADDHETIRQGLEALLKEEKDLEVVGLAGNGVEAVRLTGEVRPDVVVMDMAMPEMDGIEATEEIVRRWPEVAVIVHSMHNDRQIADAALQSGRQGLLH